MKIVVLGCGYLGYHLSEALGKTHDNVLCIGIQSAYSALMYKHYQYVDVFDESALRQIDFKDAVVIDALSFVDNHASSDEEELVIANLEHRYEKLLRLLKECGVAKYIYISSGAVYGNISHSMSEDAIPRPLNLYGRCKVRLEQTIMQSSIDYLILRLASPYGGFRMTNKRQGVIPILIEKALDQKVFEMLKPQETVRDYFYFTDLVKAVELLLINQVKNEIINVGSGKGYSLKTIIEVVERTTGEKVQIERIRSQCEIVDSISLDISKLQRLTGFECEITITTGVYLELHRILNLRAK